MQNHTTTSIAGKTTSQTEKEISKFHEHCPLADAYLRKAQTGTPVRPEQHRLVMRWPMFDCIEELQAEHWEFGGSTLLPGLLLHGASGTGKTTSAYLAIRESLECWRSFQKGIPDVIAVRAVAPGPDAGLDAGLDAGAGGPSLWRNAAPP